MDTQKAVKIIEQVARSHGVSPEEVTSEINEAIREAATTQNPKAQSLWSLIPREGDLPNAAELIAFLGQLPLSE